jgi:hypothetical protein
MSDTCPLDFDLDELKRAAGRAFDRRVLLWQMCGTAAAGVCYALLTSIYRGSNAASHIFFVCLSMLVAYVVLSAAGTLVMRLMNTAEGDGPAAASDPWHFLVDNGTVAFLAPLAAGLVTIVLAVLVALLAWAWSSEITQNLMVIPSIVVFVLAVFVIVDLLLLLFVVPAMVVVEEPPVSVAFPRLGELLWSRCLPLLRRLGIGLALSTLLLVPLYYLLTAGIDAVEWLYDIVPAARPTRFVTIVLRVFRFGLLWAPMAAFPLVFLNALVLGSYEKLIEGLDAEEDEEGPVVEPAEQSSAPAPVPAEEPAPADTAEPAAGPNETNGEPPSSANSVSDSDAGPAGPTNTPES